MPWIAHCMGFVEAIKCLIGAGLMARECAMTLLRLAGQHIQWPIITRNLDLKRAVASIAVALEWLVLDGLPNAVPVV